MIFAFPLILTFLFNFLNCDRHPVLLVPGLLSSQMTAKYIKKPETDKLCEKVNKTFLVWINLPFLLTSSVHCLVNILKLEYDVSTHSTSSPKYCTVDVPGFGKVDSIEFLTKNKNPLFSYFDNVIEKLVKTQNYSRNVDIFGAPYDFRKGPNELDTFLREVKELIENAYRKNNQKSVVVIAHSLGCLHMLRLFNRMSQAWKDKYIKSFISVGGPYGGSVKSVNTILSGYKFKFFYLNKLYIRKIGSSWPSVYYLFPNQYSWMDKPIVLTRKGNFTAKDFSKLMDYSRIRYASNHFNDIKRYITELEPPKVNVHCIFSSKINTSIMLDYREVQFPDQSPKEIYGDGDGTVSRNSLMICPQWKNKQQQAVSLNVIPSVKHFDLIKNEVSVNLINKIIMEINS